MSADADIAAARPVRAEPTALILRGAGAALAGASWLSAAIFGLYILAFYVLAAPQGRLGQWNHHLPGLYDPARPGSTAAMAAHLAMGGLLLMAGPAQLVGAVRARWPAVHRWLGRAYVTAAGLAGLGGLIFILTKGTIGGTPMNLGFGLYGVLMVLASVQAFRHARARRIVQHRAWAIRLFALAVGSWLYRMDYGFWMVLAHGAGHDARFDGPFDVVMTVFFYLPNLVAAELFIRAGRGAVHPAARLAAAGVLGLATVFIAFGSYYFTAYYWGPGILAALS